MSQFFTDTLIERFQDIDLQEIIINSDVAMSFIYNNRREIHKSIFLNPSDAIEKIQEFVFSIGLRLDPLSPSSGGSLSQQNFRWHAVIPPLCLEGGVFSIRKHRFNSIGISNYIVADELKEEIKKLYDKRANIIFCGTTGCGKTTLLNAMLRDSSSEERVIILESLPELTLHSPLWIRLVEHKINLENRGQITINQLMQECLRLYPDRIVLGEIRDHELNCYFDAVSTGHKGVLSTMHGSSLKEIQMRVVLLLTKGGYTMNYISQMAEFLEDIHLVFLERGRVPSINSIQKFKLNSI